MDITVKGYINTKIDVEVDEEELKILQEYFQDKYYPIGSPIAEVAERIRRVGFK